MLFRPLPKSASFDESQTALDVVRTKRAKQLLNDKVPRQSSGASGAGTSVNTGGSSSRTTKSGLSQERTVGCADMVADKAECHLSKPVLNKIKFTCMSPL